MKYFLMPIVGGVEEAGRSSFEYKACESCGAPVRLQRADLNVTTVEEIPSFTTTLDGDFLVERELLARLKEIEPQCVFRPAVVAGVKGSWFQVIPDECAELSQRSLRAPHEPCHRCGGVTRPRFGDYPPLEFAPPSESLPQLGFICGARQMLFFSSSVLTLLQDADPRFSASEIIAP